MVPIAAFRTRITPRVMAALDPTIDLAVLDTCIDFCEQTLVVRTLLDPTLTFPGQAEYELEASPDTAVARVIRVWCGNRELEARAEDDVDGPTAYADDIQSVDPVKGWPSLYSESAPGSIRLFPIPDADYQLTIRAALRPKRTATEVPNVLYENFADAIVDGALVRLYSMPGVPWSNPSFATAHATSYKIGQNRALLEASRGRTRPVLFVRPVPI